MFLGSRTCVREGESNADGTSRFGFEDGRLGEGGRGRRGGGGGGVRDCLQGLAQALVAIYLLKAQTYGLQPRVLSQV